MEYQRYTKKRRQPRPPVAPAPTLWQTILAPRHRNKLILAAILGTLAMGTLLVRSCGQEQPAPSTNQTANTVATTAGTKEPPRPGSITFVRLEPVSAIPGTILRAVVTTTASAEGSLTLAYHWFRNDQSLGFNSGSELDTSPFDKSDRIVVQVTPLVGDIKGEMVQSNEVVLQNRPPTISHESLGAFSNGHYTNAILAADPDNDALSFSLATAPPEMTIDPKTGVIDWPVPADTAGTYEFIVVASDGEIEAVRAFRILLDFPQAQ